MGMKMIDFDNIDDLRKKSKNNLIVMYGAGGNGEKLLKIFGMHSIAINYFCDDDYNKWDTTFCDIPVISFYKLKKISGRDNVIVILTSVFAGPILDKLNQIKVEIYEAFKLLIDEYYQNSFYKVKLSDNQIADFCKKEKIVSAGMGDKVSGTILSKIMDVIKNSGEMCYSHFFDVASEEDCYFIKEVLKALPDYPVIVD